VTAFPFHTVGVMLRQIIGREIDPVGKYGTRTKIPRAPTTLEDMMTSATTMRSSGAPLRCAGSHGYGRAREAGWNDQV
jgi:hypothetical protein